SMSLAEKVELVTGDLNFNFGFYSAPLERVGIPALAMADGPPGIRINNGAVHEGKATALPAPIALAASWNLDLARRYGEVLGQEARASGHNVFLGPAADIARVPVGGRSFESAGEDPLLNARFAAAQIEAIQSCQVLACLKHYAVNNQEYERASIDVRIDERCLREIYLRPFEIVARSSGVASLMGAFNRVNGVHACEHDDLLRRVLREEWGFRGWVMSDYGATHSTVPAAQAGLDQEQPSGAYYGQMLRRAVEEGDLAAATLDTMCARILRTLVGLGVLERPLEVSDMDSERHAAVAQEVAEAGSVLLKNEAALLPLDAAALRRVAVIGVDAASVAAAGGGSGKVRPARSTSLLDGLKQRLGASVQVDHAQGVDPISAADLLPGAPSIPSCCLSLDDEGQSGVQAEFWTNTDFLGAPFATRRLPQMALNLGFFNFPGFGAASACFPEIPHELSGRISVRFHTRLIAPADGRYRLALTLLGSARVFVDDVLVLDFRYHGTGRAGHGGGASGAAAAGPDDDVKVPDSADGAAFGQAGVPLALEGQGPVPEAAVAAASGGAASGPDADRAEVELALEQRPQGYRLRVEYAADAPSQGHLSGAQIRLGWRTPVDYAPRLQREAAALAAEADVAIVAVRCYESEHMDRPDLRLPGDQEALIRAVARANPRTVVITMSGGPVETLPWEGDVRAIVHAWYPGQEQGTALARLLFGDVNPGGRLPLSFPRSAAEGLIRKRSQYPGVEGRIEYSEGLEVGYRGFDALRLAPRFAFGHGLSYTSFDYGGLEVQADAEGFEVSCRITNTGARAGTETVQLYLGLPVAGTPPRQLADWRQVALEAGRSASVRFRVERESVEQTLATWCEGRGWQPVHGQIKVFVGASSRDIRLEGSVRR
ncbi:MAG: glycoside hydrolase family 3 protein, partial [Burkholderiales bacterium]|nr:glycoside hydrolase family 3 protein [Burkholderiales bacterium]